MYLIKPSVEKLAGLLKDFEHCRKKQNFNALNELFDMTKVKGEQMCKEDENLNKLKIESKGHFGYSTGKPASIKTIHPYKRKKAPTSSTPPNWSRCSISNN